MAENSFKSDYRAAGGGKLLVIDDSDMMVNCDEKVLSEDNVCIVTVLTGGDGIGLGE